MANDDDQTSPNLYNRFGVAALPSTSQPLSVEQQVLVLGALLRHKPVGINRHFEIIAIQDQVNKQLSTKYGETAGEKLSLTCEEIWRFLDTLYDLKGLEESSGENFTPEEFEFRLPESYLKDRILPEMKTEAALSSSNNSRSSTPRRSGGHSK
uniref:Uncharacterized protein n=1 Tax=Romanomermis culicivorax TaxID=13658 RepID=A0A915IGC3_ROMCU